MTSLTARTDDFHVPHTNKDRQSFLEFAKGNLYRTSPYLRRLYADPCMYIDGKRQTLPGRPTLRSAPQKELG